MSRVTDEFLARHTAHPVFIKKNVFLDITHRIESCMTGRDTCGRYTRYPKRRKTRVGHTSYDSRLIPLCKKKWKKIRLLKIMLQKVASGNAT